jgi:Spy/CpxP family protein refolding chaperone
VEALNEEQAKKTWDLAGKMREETFKLRGLMTTEKRDRTAISNQYKKVQDLRLQGFQARLDALEKIDGVLTKEQREQRRRFGPWWAQEAIE